jgi:hypothetical protein
MKAAKHYFLTAVVIFKRKKANNFLIVQFCQTQWVATKRKNQHEKNKIKSAN